jgi:hypothetical protein
LCLDNGRSVLQLMGVIEDPARPSSGVITQEIIREIASLVVQQVMAKIRPEDHAQPYRAEEMALFPRAISLISLPYVKTLA